MKNNNAKPRHDCFMASGEVREVISIPGMERMARFMAFFVKQVDAMSVADINVAR
ncbi:MAG: hypothetical protein WD396_03120 [Pseudohongiellaceae bacterium]